jgi:hypothetical protein
MGDTVIGMGIAGGINQISPDGPCGLTPCPPLRWRGGTGIGSDGGLLRRYPYIVWLPPLHVPWREGQGVRPGSHISYRPNRGRSEGENVAGLVRVDARPDGCFTSTGAGGGNDRVCITKAALMAVHPAAPGVRNRGSTIKDTRGTKVARRLCSAVRSPAVPGEHESFCASWPPDNHALRGDARLTEGWQYRANGLL